MLIKVKSEDRIEALCSICQPVISAQSGGGFVYPSQQERQPNRNSNANTLFIGVKQPRKMSLQGTPETIWNQELQQFDVVCGFWTKVEYFFNYYCLDQSAYDVMLEIDTIIQQNNYTGLDMSPMGSKIVENTTSPRMIDSVLQQSYKLLVDFMCYNSVTLPAQYKADGILINGNIGDAPINVDIIFE
jgi:hypothetical protein